MQKSENLKLVVYAPETHAELVRDAMGDAGAGRIGNYSHCSFSTKGTGRFKALDGSNPSIGRIGEIEAVTEEKIECVVSRDSVVQVISAIKEVHPYEEIPIDLYPLMEV